MDTNRIMNEILAVLGSIRDDKNKLEKLHEFVMNEIYEEFEPEQIPEKYKKAVTEIADYLLAGLICYFNPNTLEIEYIPKDLVVDPEEYENITGEKKEEGEFKYMEWEKCITIEPMESRESFKVMEHFINELSDNEMQYKLINALNNRRPFANFKNLVENSPCRQQWFDFRLKQWELYVWDFLQMELDS